MTGYRTYAGYFTDCTFQSLFVILSVGAIKVTYRPDVLRHRERNVASLKVLFFFFAHYTFFLRNTGSPIITFCWILRCRWFSLQLLLVHLNIFRAGSTSVILQGMLSQNYSDCFSLRALVRSCCCCYFYRHGINSQLAKDCDAASGFHH